MLLSSSARELVPWVEKNFAEANAVREVAANLHFFSEEGAILAPLFVIWFGIGIASKIAVTFVLIVVLFFFAIYSGIKEVDQRLIDRVRTLGGGRAVLLREVYLPAVTAWGLSHLKIAVGFAFTGAVVGEFVASSRGGLDISYRRQLAV